MNSRRKIDSDLSIRFRKDIANHLKSLHDPSPYFPIFIGWAKNYDDLFSENFISTSDAIGSLIENYKALGRVILCGRGGSGKSVVFQRISRLILKNNSIPLLIQMRGWTESDNGSWNLIRGHRARIGFLLERFSCADVGLNDLDFLDPNKEKVILLDGLNEINSRIGQDIINALDDFAATEPSACVLVSDRLVRREFINKSRWKLAMMLPINEIYIKSITAGKINLPIALLKSPYFLDSFDKFAVDVPTGISGIINAHFIKHALSNDEIQCASKAAFAMYASKSRSFNLSEFTKICGSRISKKLKESGDILLGPDGMAHFDHHLKHDFLSARYLSSNRRKWTHANFNQISFRASSFDSILMLVELCSNKKSAETILRHLYDWNPYAPGYVIADGVVGHVTEEMKTVILAMITERRWDPLILTAEKANDILYLIEDKLAKKLRKAKNALSARAEIRKISSSVEWFNRWRYWYLKSSPSQIIISELDDLGDTDSICGWVCANVLRRFIRMPNSWIEIVVKYARSPKTAIAWRAVHVLGAFPGKTSLRSLKQVIAKSNDSDVLFGATRSMIEIAARGGQSLGKEAISFLVKNFDFLASQPNVPEELGRAIFISELVLKDSGKSPTDWVKIAMPLLHQLVIRSNEPESREYWERIAIKFLEIYTERVKDG